MNEGLFKTVKMIFIITMVCSSLSTYFIFVILLHKFSKFILSIDGAAHVPNDYKRLPGASVVGDHSALTELLMAVH